MRLLSRLAILAAVLTALFAVPFGTGCSEPTEGGF